MEDIPSLIYIYPLRSNRLTIFSLFDFAKKKIFPFFPQTIDRKKQQQQHSSKFNDQGQYIPFHFEFKDTFPSLIHPVRTIYPASIARTDTSFILARVLAFTAGTSVDDHGHENQGARIPGGGRVEEGRGTNEDMFADPIHSSVTRERGDIVRLSRYKGADDTEREREKGRERESRLELELLAPPA